uniref:Uncharacterized protein n=1 Tax=Prolemur simus TaxID=1328070 RepID=A0A8C8Z2G7_PROSS
VTHETTHPHLFRERGANPHPQRTAEEKYICTRSVSEKQLILWRLEESSTHHNSGDIKGMKHFRCALRQRRTFCLGLANHPRVITINSAKCERFPGNWESRIQLPLHHVLFNLLFNLEQVTFLHEP